MGTSFRPTFGAYIYVHFGLQRSIYFTFQMGSFCLIRRIHQLFA